MRKSFGLSILTIMIASPWGYSLAAAGPLIDPMRPPTHMPGGLGQGDAEGQVSGMDLTITYVSEKNSYAVINNMRLRKGEMISGMQIMQIRPGVVILDRDGEQIKLNVLPTGLKKYRVEK